MKKMILTLLGTLAFPAIAFAHPGHDMANFVSGFSHPFTGIDHLLVMLAVGYWAGQSQSAARWQLPLQFVLFMLGGVVLGAMIPGMAFIEAAIAVSVLAMGLVILLNTSFNRVWQLVLTTVFALLHGFVHGQELVAAGNGMAAVAGMLLATIILLSAGVYLASFKNQLGLLFQRGFAALLTLSGAYLLIM
ncbi:HupE/UreJ family protein [Methylophaga pinxianii]|uniref:HupE/UreJ family protein n=1 Tax=Methylophaga pinxianii TaxID=2881052 RepID=UPI001CF422A6|nr:HupE/UreJ family protein [Methylophaga pinxianii]MCB2428281.1 HupE/UreJ family protein [Methylophaga pinxianii]UPH45834.1 HupE/UreJ family protein [Methylophaga pinxianii]